MLPTWDTEPATRDNLRADSSAYWVVLDVTAYVTLPVRRATVGLTECDAVRIYWSPAGTAAIVSATVPLTELITWEPDYDDAEVGA